MSDQDTSKPESRGQSAMTDAPSVYANLCNIRVNQEEIIFQFGQRSVNNPDEIHGIINVFTSLPHAKRILHALAGSIQRYEAIFGEVAEDPIANLPPEILEELRRTGQIDDES